MSKVMGIYVKFTKTTHQIWSCHVTLASNSENFYFSPDSVLNFFGVNWLKNKKVTGKKQIWGGKHPPPRAYRVKVLRRRLEVCKLLSAFKPPLLVPQFLHTAVLHSTLLPQSCCTSLNIIKLNHATSCFNIKFSSDPTQTLKSKIKRVSKEDHMPCLIFRRRALLIEWIKCTYFTFSGN